MVEMAAANKGRKIILPQIGSPMFSAMDPSGTFCAVWILGLGRRALWQGRGADVICCCGLPIPLYTLCYSSAGRVDDGGVRSCYDEGKRTAETLTMDYHCGANLEVRIARIFNSYGPRMCIDDGRVVSNFVAQAPRKEPLTVHGDGKQTRSFLYVPNLVGHL
ncbi:hypothetical protein ZWY2020_000693 [Hordeum vulgare]|nr:hypothetical protein ZWY2020_000693 [Hordeum vulgare]